MKSNKEIIHMQHICNMYLNVIVATGKYPDLVSLKFDATEECREVVLATFETGETVKCNVAMDNDWGMLKDILWGLSKSSHIPQKKGKENRQLLCKLLCDVFKLTDNYYDLVELEYHHIRRSEIVLVRFRNGGTLSFKFRTVKTGCHLVKKIIDGLDSAAGGFMPYWEV